MKLIVQIPCFNEETTLARSVVEIPRQIYGVDCVEILVVDDGSGDGSVAVAWNSGVDHVVRHNYNRGLAGAFRSGIDACLRLGADVVVNMDADGQYAGDEIPKLVAPILKGEADMVIGDRQIGKLTHFSPVKKALHKFGSFVVRKLSGIDVPDAASGFRAFSREAALRLTVLSSFSHTIETLIQAGKEHMAVVSVPVRANRVERPSRLFKSTPEYIRRCVATMLRTYLRYEPRKVFATIGALLMLTAVLAIGWFLYWNLTDTRGGSVAVLVLSGVCGLSGLLTLVMGLVADLISANRRLLELTLEKVRRIELEQLDEQPQKLEQAEPQADWKHVVRVS